MQSPSIFRVFALSVSATVPDKTNIGELNTTSSWMLRGVEKEVKLEFDQITYFQRCNKMCVAPTVKNAITFVISYFDAVIFLLSEIPLL